MIYAITETTDPLVSYINDDPVRPYIPLDKRVNDTARIFALMEDDKVLAMVCAKFCKGVPANEAQLMDEVSNPDTVVFYTIWSYRAGAGAQLITEGLEKVKQEFPNITRFVTLSPCTNMAERFHLRNGASIFRVNSGSVNYEYT